MSFIITLVIVALLAVIIPFAGIVVLSSALLVICRPQSRLVTVVCFIIPAILVPAALIALNSASEFWRYSGPQGPVIWFIVWPALILVALGVITAAFAVAAIKKRMIPLSRDGAATRAI